MQGFYKKYLDKNTITPYNHNIKNKEPGYGDKQIYKNGAQNDFEH